MAPLKAFRNVGRNPGYKAADFGFSEPDGTVTITIKGTDHKLVLGENRTGGLGPVRARRIDDGGLCREGRQPSGSEAGNQRFVEHDLHEWKEADVTGAKVTAGAKTRQIVRGSSEGKKFWADPGAPTQNDETIGNWMTKVERLRPNEYAASPPERKEIVVRIDYTAPGGGGYLELVKASSGAPGKPDYFIATERTRQYGKVTQNVGEQVEQDVGAVLK